MWDSSKLRRGTQGPTCGASGKSTLHACCEGPPGFLCSRLQDVGHHLELRPEPQCSSPVPTWISGSSGVSTGESGLILCGDKQVTLLLSWKTVLGFLSCWDTGIGAFNRGATGLSHLAIMFRVNPRVTVESVQGSQVYMEFIGTWGSLKWRHDPLSSSRVSS